MRATWHFLTLNLEWTDGELTRHEVRTNLNLPPSPRGTHLGIVIADDERAHAALQLRAWPKTGARGLSKCAFAAAQRAAQRLGFTCWDDAGMHGCTPDVLSEAIEDLESQ